MFHDRCYEFAHDQGLLERAGTKVQLSRWWDLALLATSIVFVLAFFGLLRLFL